MSETLLEAARLARANRKRLAVEEGAKAMDEALKEAAAVRKNMERLRELRLTKEADAVRQQIAAEIAQSKSRRRG